MKLKIRKEIPQRIPQSRATQTTQGKKFSNFFFFGVPIGGAAGDQVKEEQRAREDQNRINAEKQRIQLEQEKIANDARIAQNLADTKLREIEAQLALENVKAKQAEIELRKAEALQKIEFEKNMGAAAVDRATKLNQAELTQATTESGLADNKLYLMFGGGFLALILLFLVLK